MSQDEKLEALRGDVARLFDVANGLIKDVRSIGARLNAVEEEVKGSRKRAAGSPLSSS